ncbi:hypothetical protein VNO80_10757 [Phaseolus coccineus]|uniref:Uncharacterized protein n=1 Tax=Phaseolus coccineus TaxID=3886 RepID=A0AAN9NDZ9_PHACN
MKVVIVHYSFIHLSNLSLSHSHSDSNAASKSSFQKSSSFTAAEDSDEDSDEETVDEADKDHHTIVHLRHIVSFLMWSLDSILTDLGSQQTVAKGYTKRVVQKVYSEFEVAMFVVSGMDHALTSLQMLFSWTKNEFSRKTKI